jgi:uncharacterized membrane protein YsdA (DUF1294 family)
LIRHHRQIKKSPSFVVGVFLVEGYPIFLAFAQDRFSRNASITRVIAGCLGSSPSPNSAGAIGAVAMFRHQTLKPEFAFFPEQLWPDLALLKIRYKDAIRPAGQ